MNISITKLTKVYRGGVPALDGIDLSLGTGMIGLLGANGAGKTTLMRILTGVLRATSGQVIVGGHDLATAAGRAGVRRMLGYLPQELTLYPDLTGRELLDYFGLLKGVDDERARRTQIGSILELTDLQDVAGRRISTYSGGMKRRLGIAQTLLGDPRLIIVDEPTSGLDPEQRMRFRVLLARLGEGRTVILSTHILDDVAQTCPRVAVLRNGHVAYNGATDGLTGAAEDITYLIPPGVVVPTDATVVSATARDGGTWYRVVSRSPIIGASTISPTLEDGYAALVQDSPTKERFV